MNHSNQEPELCPECIAKMDACFDRLTSLVSDMMGDLEPWQLVVLLINTAGGVATSAKLTPEEFLTYVRRTVFDEYDLTISAMQFSDADFHTEGEA